MCSLPSPRRFQFVIQPDAAKRVVVAALLLCLPLWTSRCLSAAEVNVCNFGAKGDGRADDTAALQAAYNATVNGDVLLVPKGVYRTSNSLVWVGAKRVDVRASGARILYPGGGAAITYGAPSGQVVQFARFDGFMIYAPKGTGIVFQNLKRSPLLQIEQVACCNVGVVLRGYNEACAYLTLRIIQAYDCLTAIKGEAIGSGWVNKITIGESVLESRRSDTIFVDLRSYGKYPLEGWILDGVTMQGFGAASVLATRHSIVVMRDPWIEPGVGTTFGFLDATGKSRVWLRGGVINARVDVPEWVKR